MAKERETQYEKGYDTAVKSALQVIAILSETYPQVPTTETLGLFMTPSYALALIEAIGRYHDRVGTVVTNRIAEGAQA